MNRQFDWKNIKKSDWIVLGLIGAILLVIMLPEKSAGESSVFWNAGSSKGNTLQVTDNDAISAAAARDGSGKDGVEQYVSKLEEKLEEVLGEMEGVGKVKVMITISDYGEAIIEKDTVDKTNTVSENDSNGGSRDTYEREIQSETVQIENDSGTYPYVGKELLPTIEGIVVVAEGGGNAAVVSQISKAAMALFPIEAHKIIVVKMSQGG